ncbi:hypothetical protein FC70_GL001735 [Paucilactobacillus oligofermentans DSM 15707 = LMG 22743]|uniref:Ribosomal processing cysteine protease Prp n=1 Tax=Paucilactobacillus oligofermentans DSM 15707 = LMG 22743 TaxID=1423778 RepID=A0A0R1RL95_9LACO|nr:ribosomal-processing cysteine protease Prp [Paucilactobacillus oligofermentans]KRL54933.1 hypothetical protein FC70_GL001735 [Paucilactobacillus oligofermentans DSM 15707 = LMG 22743]CUS26152.1 Phage DUF464-containing ribosomal protein [Paucilactobacillus oligofermentans DSM 15707 = LMG 22743]
MIKANFELDSQNNILSFQVTGHAESGPYGQDIVCAAISVLTISTINGLEEVIDMHPQVISDDTEGGFISVQKLKIDHDSQILLKTLINGVRDVAQSYPDNIIVEEITKI